MVRMKSLLPFADRTGVGTEEYLLTVCRLSVRCILSALVVCVLISGSVCGYGQARATATEVTRLSVFAGGEGTWTGLNRGRTGGVTAGADLRFRSFFTFQPSLEVRGTLPLFKGGVDNQKNLLGGVQIARPLGRFKPYVDILIGRGQIDYHGGYPDATDTFTYFRNISKVISPGVGVDVDLSGHFALKADAQYQRYDTPVTTSGKLGSKALLGAVVYRFDFNRSPRNIR